MLCWVPYIFLISSVGPVAQLLRSQTKLSLYTDQIRPGKPPDPLSCGQGAPSIILTCHGLRALERSKSVTQPPDMRSTVPYNQSFSHEADRLYGSRLTATTRLATLSHIFVLTTEAADKLTWRDSLYYHKPDCQTPSNPFNRLSSRWTSVTRIIVYLIAVAHQGKIEINTNENLI